MDSTQANVSTGLLYLIKARAGLLLVFFATLLTVLAVWGALYQKPHFNAYRTAPSLMSRDYWAHPVEQNAFRRLPVIGKDLSDVFALPGGKHIWAVGDEGLILHSGDGGFTWKQQTVATDTTEPKPSPLSGFSLLSEAWAGEPMAANPLVNAGQITTTDKADQMTATGTVQIPPAAEQNSAAKQAPEPPITPEIQKPDQSSEQTVQPAVSKQTPFSEFFTSVVFIDANHGWAVGQGGVFVATQDGGKNWQDIVYRRFPAPWFYAVMLTAIMLFGLAWAIFSKQGKPTSTKEGIANRVVTDKPAGPGSPDFLGARRIAQELTRFLVNRNTQPPVTIAITGEWGSGKSSIMNYLFAGLKREGLKPVWFNAWHHREELNVLASILANVHQQAIKPWWSPSGFWFRLRLLWKRNWLIKPLLLVMLFGVSLLLAGLISSPDKWRETQDYALYLLHIEEPVIFPQEAFNTLCPVVAAASDGEKQIASGSAKATTETAAKAVSAAQSGNKTAQTSSLQAADASTQQAGALAAKSDTHQDATGQGLFDPEQCRLLQALSGPPVKYHNSLQCSADAAHPCYATPNEFLSAVKQRLRIELTTETEARLLKVIEHLHPEPPVTISSTQLKWLTGLIALVGLLTVKGMALLGLSQIQLFQGLLNKSGIVMQSAEPVGSRLLFERHFKLITQLLGQRRLVLFIDDLDRCDREHTRKVLEITNFLASSGDLFMVLGMAPRYVLANVTLSFQDLAKAVHEADMLNGEKPDGAADKDAGQSWFARHYLQKLIHIEVPVPKAKTEQVLAMLKAEQVEPDITEELEQQLDSLLAAFGKLLRLALLVAALVGGAYWGYSLGQPQQDIPLAQDAAQNVARSSESSNSVKNEGETPVEPKTKESSRPERAFKPGYTDENVADWPVWLALLLTVGMFGCGLGLFYLMRHLEIIKDKNWLSWLEPLLRRLKVKLLGPELRDDSASFTDALDIWHKLIAITDPSPRNLKAFLNRLRYFASRYSGAVDSQREAQLVALATMHYAFDEKLDEAIALMQAYETNSAQSKFVSSSLREDARWAELDDALKMHREKFSAFPSLEDRKFFKDLCEDIRIHKRD